MDNFYRLKSNTEWYKLLDDARNDVDAKVCVQQLDCRSSWARQDTDKTFDDIINISKQDKMYNHFVFIHRKYMREHIEVGLSTGTDISYFIFIELPIEKLEKYINLYGLLLYK